MKKILIAILIILLIMLATFTIIDGIQIGNFEVLSYAKIMEHNDELEAKITEAATLTSVTFPEKLQALTAASSQLVTTREQYQDKIAYSSEEDVRRAKEIKNYNVEFLFTRLGNYAKQHGLNMDLAPQTTSATGVYDLKFILRGKYSSISEFIRSIENDTNLNFKIENFKLTPDTSNQILKAEFVVSELKLNVDSGIVTTITESTTQNTTQNTAQNTTQNTTNTSTVGENTDTTQ